MLKPMTTRPRFQDQREKQGPKTRASISAPARTRISALRCSARPWIKFEVLNALNNQKLIGWDTTIAPNNAGPRDADGLPTTFIKGPRFGTATANSHYPRPRPGLDGGRTLQFALGLRF